MSNFSASVPVAFLQQANAELEEQGFGPDNFSIPAYAGPSPSHALFHAWSDPVFQAAVALIPEVVITDTIENPSASVSATTQEVGATWGNDALPLEGYVTPGLYIDSEQVLWWVIQPYDTAIYPDPYAIPSQIRLAKVPGEVLPWVQPLDQFDAYKLVNPFTGKPDRCTHNGEVWDVESADGAGNNIWEPGVFGWKQMS